MSNLAEEVAALMAEVAAREIMPRFRLLKDSDIEEKSKGDYVTIADREAELWLTPRLEALVPGSQVLGEEAAAADPSVMSLAESTNAVWTVDPVDGTANFIAGRDTFGVMVSLIKGGEAVRAWIYLPVTGELAVAERGAGAMWHSGGKAVPMRAGRSAEDFADVVGAFNIRFMPDDWRRRIEGFAGRIGRISNDQCSAVDYTAVARGLKDYITYHRMMPWDHVPGSLILTEAGGIVRDMASGADYAPRTLAGPHLVARDEAGWTRIADAIRAAGMDD